MRSTSGIEIVTERFGSRSGSDAKPSVVGGEVPPPVAWAIDSRVS
jgi:hypothetical protein